MSNCSTPPRPHLSRRWRSTRSGDWPHAVGVCSSTRAHGPARGLGRGQHLPLSDEPELITHPALVPPPDRSRSSIAGIPSSPPHIRPLTYSLLLGTLGRTKAAWPAEANASRARYGELTDRFLTEITQSKASRPPDDRSNRLRWEWPMSCWRGMALGPVEL